MTSDPLQAHSHDNNTAPPTLDPTLQFTTPDGKTTALSVAQLAAMPQAAIDNHFIITDHGAHGPYRLTGVTLATVIAKMWQGAWSQVEAMGADGYGNRIFAPEIAKPDPDGPILLVLQSDDEPLTRQNGLVRLLVPSEKDNALRQIKWLQTLRIRP